MQYVLNKYARINEERTSAKQLSPLPSLPSYFMTHFLTQAGGTEWEWPGPEGMGYGTWEVPSHLPRQ